MKKTSMSNADLSRVDRSPADERLRLEDVSRLLGHSSTRVTQDVYIEGHGDLYQRLCDATATSWDSPR